MNWTPPTAERLYEVVDATWPAAEKLRQGPFVLRRGAGGGKRASSATLIDAVASVDDIEVAAEAMKEMAQAPLFMIREGDGDLDRTLEGLDYSVLDPVTLFAVPSANLAELDPKGLTAIRTSEPMAVMAEIWAEGGVTSPRLDVMRRVDRAKVCLMGRVDSHPTGVGFIAVDGDIGMVHALEVAKPARRKGLGLQMMGAAAAWALEQGAETFALVVLSENDAACGLYRKIGMVEVGKYHYRIKETK